MPEAATAEKKEVVKLPPLPPQTVTRNKKDCVLKTLQIVRGKNEGKQFLGPEFTPENLDEMKDWLGVGDLVNVIQQWAKKQAWAIWCDHLPDEKKGETEFDMVGFLKDMQDISSAGMKLAEIRRLMEEVQAKLSLLIRDGDIWRNKETNEKSPDLMLIDKLNAEYLSYKSMEENRSRKGKEETVDEPAVVTN